MPRQSSQPRGSRAWRTGRPRKSSGLVRCDRTVAKPAHQALGDDGAQPASDHIGLDPHIQEPADDLAGTAGMKGRQDQVAGEGGLKRDLGGRLVADLADGDHLGVLPQAAISSPTRASDRPPG